MNAQRAYDKRLDEIQAEHDDMDWANRNYKEPVEFEAAIEFEKRLQSAYAKSTALHSVPYLHSSRIPLELVEFKTKEKEPSLFGNECEGICGV